MNKQLAIITIMEGGYGAWSMSAYVALRDDMCNEFVKEFREQLQSAPKEMNKTFPEDIINTLK